MNIRISSVREIKDSRSSVVDKNPIRRGRPDPLDPRLECPLGRLRLDGKISDSEYYAGCRWRRIYLDWLSSIGAPNPFPRAIDYDSYTEAQESLGSNLDDEDAELIAKAFRAGETVLKRLGPRVFHSVNAIAVYEEPEELGDFEFTAAAAKKGLAALAEVFC